MDQVEVKIQISTTTKSELCCRHARATGHDPKHDSQCAHISFFTKAKIELQQSMQRFGPRSAQTAVKVLKLKRYSIYKSIKQQMSKILIQFIVL